MSDDYFATADRMQRDNQILYDNKCLHNACDMAGYVVEAGLKAIIRADEIADGVSPTRHPHHVVPLVSLVTGTRLIIGKGFDDTKLNGSELLKRWHPRHRYQPREWDDEMLAEDFQSTAEYMMEFLTDLFLDGLIR